MKRQSDHELRREGFLQERLWVVLLPLLAVSALLVSSWAALLLRDATDAAKRHELETRVQALIDGVSTELGLAIESTNRTRTRFLVDSIAKMANGRAVLYHGKGGLLAQADGSPRRAAAHSRMPEVHEEILIWGPAKGVGDKKVGEIRIHVQVPARAPWPWTFFAVVLAVYSLITAIILFGVSRCLAPVTKLGSLFTRLGEHGPDAAIVPGERLAEFGQVRNEILDCLDRLKSRQLRAEESFVEVALSLAREYEYHREGTIGHAQRVRRYASWVADRLRLPPKERDALEVAALCHDLGKIPSMPMEGIGGDVASVLDETAKHIDTMHPVLGAAFFEAMPGLEDVARLLVAHHENWDGSGFPNELIGEDIPLGARLLRIADAFDRAYSAAADDESAQDILDKLAEEKGESFDPFLFDLFREEVAVHLLERRRLQVTLQAYQKSQEEAASTTPA